MTSIAKWFIFFLSIFMLSACDDADSQRNELMSLTLSPTSSYIYPDSTQTYDLLANYSDGTTIAAAQYATWSSSDSDIATVQLGEASGLSEGTTTISASLDGLSVSANLYVSDTMPTGLTLGTNSAFIHTFSQSDITTRLEQEDLTTANLATGSGLAFEVSENICDISIVNTQESTDRLQAPTGSEPCQAEITAIYRDLNYLKDTITIQYIPNTIADFSLLPYQQNTPTGTEIQYQALIRYESNEIYDASSDTNISWTSSDPSIATISTSGLVSTLTSGTTTISAALHDQTASATLTVTDTPAQSISLLPYTKTLPIYAQQAYTVLITYHDGTVYDATQDTKTQLTSMNDTIASINNDSEIPGVVQALSVGETQIRATFGELDPVTADLSVISSAAMSINISPQNQILSVNDKQQYLATLFYENGFTQDISHNNNAYWTSDATDIASVNDNGMVTAVSEGTANITVTYQYMDTEDPLQTSASVTVNSATPDYITVTPQNLHRGIDTTQAYTAKLTYSNGWTKDITTDPNLSWSSSNSDIARMDDTGNASVLTEGEADIQATYRIDENTTLTHSSPLLATNATPLTLSIVEKNQNLPLGSETQLSAELTFSDGTVIDVTKDADLFWHSEDQTIANVDQGMITAKMAGTAQINTTYELDENTTLSDTTDITILDVIPYELTLTDEAQTVGLTSEFQYTATLWYSEGESVDVTHHSDVHWHSSNMDVATVQDGYVNALSSGPTTITVFYQDDETTTFKASTELTVSSASPSSIAISPNENTTEADPLTSNSIDVNSDELILGTFIEQSYTAILTFDDDTSIDVTNSNKLAWFTEKDKQDVAISSDNKVYTQTAGNSSTNAFYQGSESIELFDDSALTVNDSIPTSIRIAISDEAELYEGSRLQLSAYATFEDANTPEQDITHHSSSYWSSSDTDMITISNQPNAKGLAYGVAVSEDITIKLTFFLPASTTPLTASITLSVLEDTLSAYWITNIEGEIYDKDTVAKTISMSTHSETTLYAYVSLKSGAIHNVSDVTQWCVSSQESTQEEADNWCNIDDIATISQGEGEYNAVTVTTNTLTTPQDSPSNIQARLPLEYINVTPIGDLTHLYVTPLELIVENE
ncbi:Ig-like domain-containing protein [uncultured Shewanella sp.]|uniref:Ig-like domain-containing protein n=1 Tax=uncultured Shewanella sp. TaxID=173975 RepID=UPI0026222492|nr:Ig-like domain-containing protein [uncultured Shewanella sp.]